MACDRCDTCQVCDTCQDTCYSCQGCYNCNKCDSCQLCVNGDKQGTDGCLTAQKICATSNKLSSLCNNIFEFSPRPNTTTQIGPNEGMFNKDSWDAICEWINKRYSYGKDAPGGNSYPKTAKRGGDKFKNSTLADVTPFTATEFNRVANEIDATTVKKHDKILSAYFMNVEDMGILSLEEAASDYKIDDNACNCCNVACDVKCNTCQKQDTGNDKCSSQKCSGQKCSQKCSESCSTPETQ